MLINAIRRFINKFGGIYFIKRSKVDIIGPPPAFDSELAKHLVKIFEKIPASLTKELIPRSRELTRLSSMSDKEICRGGAFKFQEISVNGPPNAPNISLIICQPTATPGPHPVIYHIHGGGMVAGSNRSEELKRELNRAEELQLGVVAVNYRLAPEHPDPAPIEDCYAGLLWLYNNAHLLNFVQHKIMTSGNSAGGGLTAGLTLLARYRNGPHILAQMLQCPMLDDRCNTISSQQMKFTGLWNTVSNLTGWDALLGSRRGGTNVSSFAAPAREEDLSGLPPTFIDVGSVESLRDEAVTYASRIWKTGGNAELHVWGGAFHSFDQWVPEAIISKSADKVRVEWIRRILAL
jgi:acetyl esterase/lipase